MASHSKKEKSFQQKKQEVINLQPIYKQNSQKENPFNIESFFTVRYRAIYILLAFFFGTFGLHNFYAGYYKNGIIQLLTTLFLFWLVIPIIIIYVWIFIEIFTVKTDAIGVPMNTTGLRLTVIILTIVFFLPVLLFTCSLGGLFLLLPKTSYEINQPINTASNNLNTPPMFSGNEKEISPFSEEKNNIPQNKTTSFQLENLINTFLPTGVAIDKPLFSQKGINFTLHFEAKQLCLETAQKLHTTCENNRIYYQWTYPTFQSHQKSE